jgi:hypothetical protein
MYPGWNNGWNCPIDGWWLLINLMELSVAIKKRLRWSGRQSKIFNGGDSNLRTLEGLVVYHFAKW